MLAEVFVAVAVAGVSLALGLLARARVYRDPAGDGAGAVLVTPRRWRPVAGALLRPDRPLAALLIWLMLVDTVLALAAPWPLMLVVDYGLNHRPYPHWLAPLASLPPAALAAVAASAGLLLLALGSVAGYLVTFLAGAIGERATARLRTGLVEHLLRARPGTVAGYPLGELTSRVGADAAAVASTVTEAVETLVPDVAVLAGMAGLTALLDWRLTAVVLGVIPLYAVTARRRNRAVRGAQKQARARSGELATLAAGLLARVPLVHVFGRAGSETEQYRAVSARAATAAVGALDASARFAPVTDTLPGLGLAAALVIGTLEVTSGRLTVGGLLVFLAYLSSLTGPVRSLARFSSVVARGTASRDRVADLLSLPPVPDTGVAQARKRRGGAPRRPVRDANSDDPVRRLGLPVRLAQVSYAHQPGHPVLTAASLDVPAGAFVCVTGPSGSGKSTLLSLLVRLAEPQAGSVTIGGREVSAIPVSELRRLVTLVPQDPWLHAGTIAENIAYGRPAATRAEIAAAATRAGVAAFAAALPEGYGTQVGQHGGRLSGGQQRRVAIARALLMDTPVLLLDEPTAGLDPGTESRLISDLLVGTRGKTLILVTHNPRLASLASEVVRVEHGFIHRARVPGRLAPVPAAELVTA
jgi:ATP-binding cassette, subfamily B, bacterial